MAVDQCVVAGESFEFVRRRNERMAGHLRQLRGHALPELRVRIQSSSNRGAADGQLAKVGQCVLQVLKTVIQLRYVSGEFLAQGQWGGVWQVGAADLDDRLEGLRFARKRVAQLADRRGELLFQGGDRRHVHRGRKGVVRRLPAVYVIVRVDLPPFAARAAE